MRLAVIGMKELNKLTSVCEAVGRFQKQIVALVFSRFFLPQLKKNFGDNLHNDPLDNNSSSGGEQTLGTIFLILKEETFEKTGISSSSQVPDSGNNFLLLLGSSLF